MKTWTKFYCPVCVIHSAHFYSLGAAEAAGPEPEKAGAGDGQSKLQKPTAGQEGGAASGRAGCQ